MSRIRRRRRHAGLRTVRLAIAILAAALLALAPVGVADAKRTSHHHHSVRHRHAHTRHRRHRRHKRAGARTAAAAATSAGGSSGSQCTPTAGDPGAIDSATQAFLTHLYAAHLSTSPATQANQLLSNPDNYVLVHTALAQAMLASGLGSASQLGAVLQQVSVPFWAHIYNAHLSQSPAQQVNSIVSNPDQYVLLHTVWAETMLTPLTNWFEALLGGTPGTSCPAPGGSGGSSGSGGSTGSGGSGAKPGAQSVMVMNYSFMPASITVSAGTKVTWTNDDTVAHTVTSSGGGPLNSPSIAPNSSWSYTFATPGTYRYFCAIHPNMTGTVTVQ
jgi:plastocyanin